MARKPLDPRQMAFWSQEERELWNALSPLLLKIHIAGGVNGESLLPASLRVLVNWDLVNTKALEWLYTYRLGDIAGIMGTTRDRTIKAIDDWIRSGEPLPNLEERLKRWFDDKRANSIAVTEVTRVFASGNKAAFASTGMVTGKKFQTSVDERVCPICGPLHNVVVGLDEGFTPEGPGVGPDLPPLHPKCRCWILPVVDMGGVRSEIERAIEEAYSIDGAVLYALDVRGRRKDWTFPTWGNPRHLADWLADGLRVEELIERIPYREGQS